MKKIKEDFEESIKQSELNYEKFKEDFSNSREKIVDLEVEFVKKVKQVRSKIEEFKKKVVEEEDYELQLQLEYEIRTEINRIYNMRLDHESLCSGLVKRLDDVEVFNQNSEMIQRILDVQLIKFIDKWEVSLLRDIAQKAQIKLSLMASIDGLKKVQGGPVLDIENINQIFNETNLCSPITDAEFKAFLRHFKVYESSKDECNLESSRDFWDILEYSKVLQEDISKAKDDFKDLELDQRNEMEESIKINTIFESKPVVSIQKNSSNPSSVKSEKEKGTEKDFDWTSNHMKSKKLYESIEKQQSSLFQLLSIFEEQLQALTKYEIKLVKIISRQLDQILRTFLFKKVSRYYQSKRTILNSLIKTIQALSQISGTLKWEVESLISTVYDNEKYANQMSQRAKMSIFSFLKKMKTAEITIRSLVLQSICGSFVKEMQVIDLLCADKYPDLESSVGESISLLNDQQKDIRKGYFIKEEKTDLEQVEKKEPVSMDFLAVGYFKKEANSSLSRNSSFRTNKAVNLGNEGLDSERSPSLNDNRSGIWESARSRLPSTRENIMSTSYMKIDILNKLFTSMCNEWYVNSYFEVLLWFNHRGTSPRRYRRS